MCTSEGGLFFLNGQPSRCQGSAICLDVGELSRSPFTSYISTFISSHLTKCLSKEHPCFFLWLMPMTLITGHVKKKKHQKTKGASRRAMTHLIWLRAGNAREKCVCLQDTEPTNGKETDTLNKLVLQLPHCRDYVLLISQGG